MSRTGRKVAIITGGSQGIGASLVAPTASSASAFEICDEGQARERLRPYVWRRASAALEALETGRARYLQDGYA
jgi:NAD(P)-dependent dehydrogenase (short-subunit alcohol dehydrogenase family)